MEKSQNSENNNINTKNATKIGISNNPLIKNNEQYFVGNN